MIPAPPECPPGVDEAKWALVTRQFEAMMTTLDEAAQEHLGPPAVVNLMVEAIVSARKLAVEYESVIASLRRSVKKAAAA